VHQNQELGKEFNSETAEKPKAEAGTETGIATKSTRFTKILNRGIPGNAKDVVEGEVYRLFTDLTVISVTLDFFSEPDWVRMASGPFLNLEFLLQAHVRIPSAWRLHNAGCGTHNR